MRDSSFALHVFQKPSVSRIGGQVVYFAWVAVSVKEDHVIVAEQIVETPGPVWFEWRKVPGEGEAPVAVGTEKPPFVPVGT